MLHRETQKYPTTNQLFGSLLLPSEIISNIELGRLADYEASERMALIEFAFYVVNFLALPHVSLGRPGSICPFVRTALQKGLVRLTATKRALTDKEELASAIDTLLDTFRAMPPKSQHPVAGDAIFKTVIAVMNQLPTDSAPDLIDAVQQDFKPAYIRKGLMIGQLYPSSAVPGLHNPDFHPFASPKPSLAVRHLTIFDAPFLIDRDENIVSYLGRFGDEGRQRLEGLVEQNDLDAMRIRAIKTLLVRDRARAEEDAQRGRLVRG